VHDVQIGEEIGRGAFGQVLKGRWQGVDVALKTIPNDQMRELLEEARVLQSLRHPNVVMFWGLFSANSANYIVIEYLALGSLHDLLLQSQDKIKMGNIIRMARDVAAGMSYIEQRKIVHRDVAARNLLVSGAHPNYIVKVSDFGLSKSVTEHGSYYIQTGKFPVKWTAPEALQFNKYSSKSDVWSFGITLWEILNFGMNPYPGFENYDVLPWLLAGNRLEIPSKTPPAIKNLIRRCWEIEPANRPSFGEIYKELDEIARKLKL